MAISQRLNEDIERKRGIIQSNPDYYLKRSKIVKRDLRKICDVYTFWLENPDLRRRVLVENGKENGRQLRKVAREGIKDIKKAWRHLSKTALNSNFIDSVDSGTVREVGKLVCPYVNSKGYRDSRVTLSLKFTPPNPIKVSELVDEFCYQLHENDYSPVEAAAFTHLTLAGIQPFFDGNKRTARLLQDRILVDFGLPPAVIPAGERDVYIDLLEQGLVGQRDGDYGAQRPFFDYIGGKVNTALDNILDDLSVSRYNRK